MQRIALSVVAALVLAGCATTNTSYPRPVVTQISPPISNAPNIYSSAARAPLHSELFACHSYGSNLGLIGQRGEAANYTPYIETPAGSLLRDPTEVSCLSSGFGWRGVADGGGRQHNGIDLANAEGGFIYAAGDGRIAVAEWRGGFGNFIEIDHGNGVRTRYGHLVEFDPNLRPGAFIAAGTPMGRMGMTGNATGVHLHYEVIVDGLLVDPLNYGVQRAFETTPVVQTYRAPLPIAPPAPVMEEAPVVEAPPPPAIEPQLPPPTNQSFPDPVRLQRPDGLR